MSKPITGIFPIENGKLITPLDCNGLQLLNLDTDNLNIPGNGNGSNDTGTTTAILKGDGNHGFADAIPDTDYATAGSVALKEDSTSHDADVIAIQSDITTLQTDVALKANSAAVTAALALKADAADLTAYISSNNAAVALKANSADVTTALAAKADASATTTALAGKEPLLPTTANDSYILARHNAGSGSSWFFVDPVSLGTTNQSFIDGQSFTNTNFDSASAQFNSGDVGKTITGTNILAATTISSITSATRVVLSQATTGTGSSLPFTIFNRITVAGGGGTVTSVSVNNDAANTLFSTSVSNATTSATIGITMSTAVAANNFWGNPTAFLGAATFMTPLQSRQSLGATTSGSSLLQVPNPNPAAGNVPVWIRLLADNTAQTRTASQTVSDLGAESALTFSSPLARSVNAISIPAATDSVAGYMTAADHLALSGKVSGTRLLTMTSPLLIDGAASANLASDRTISMPASASNVDGTGQVSGYLRGADFFNFLSKPPSNRTISTTAPLTGGGDLGANRTIAIPRATTLVDGYLASADFNIFNSGSPRTVVTAQATGIYTVSTTTPPVTRIMLNMQVTTPSLIIVLPPAVNYGSLYGYPNLEIVDIVSVGGATVNFPVILRRQGSDLINEATSDLTLPKGFGYLRLNSDGNTRWTITKYYTDSFRDATNSANVVGVSVSAPGTLTLASGSSVTVKPTDTNIPGVVLNILPDGTASKGQLTPSDLVPQEFTIGTAGVNIASGASFTVSDTGTVDTVRIAGTLTGPITIIWPTASFYNLGESITLFDASGSLSQPTNVVTVTHSVGSLNTFNGALSFAFDEPNGRKVLTSDHATNPGNWAVSLVKTSIQPFRTITAGANSTFTVVADRNAVKQNARFTLANGANALAITGPYDGMSMEFVIIQPSSGAAGTLTLPLGSYVANTGGGIISLTATNGATDRLRGSYDGTTSRYFWDVPLLNHTSTPVPNAPTGLAAGSITSNQVTLTWTDNSANETGFSIERQNVTGGIPYTEITQTAANAVTYTDTGLTPSTSYNYRIRAFNAGGFSTYNGPVNAVTLSGAPVADAWEVHFTDGVANPASLTATATVGPNATLIYPDWTTSTQSSTGAAFAPTAGMAQTVGNPGTVPQGTPGTTPWTYRVLAFKNSTNLHNQNGVFATTTGSAVLDGTNFNRITWLAVTGADYYSVYRTVAGTTPNTTGRLTGTGPGFTALTFDDKAIATDGNALPTDAGGATDVHTAVASSAITYGTMLLSVTFWAKSTFATTGTDAIIQASEGSNIFRISAISGNRFQVNYTTGNVASSKTATFPNTLVNDNAWHLICLTMDNSQSTHLGTEIGLYYNGSATSQTATYTSTGTGPLTFAPGAAVIGSVHFAGSIDDVRIYKHIVTTAEMAALASGGAL